MKILCLFIAVLVASCSSNSWKTSGKEQSDRRIASVYDDSQYAGSWSVKLEPYLCGNDFRWKIKSCEFTLSFDENFNCTAATGEFFEDTVLMPLEEPKEPYSVKRKY